MTETFMMESYFIALYHIIALFLIVLTNLAIYLKVLKSPLLSSFFVLQGILILWIIAKILKTFAPDTNIKFFFVVCQYAGVCFLGTAFIVFAYIFARGTPPPKKLMLPVFMTSALFFLVVATNPLHHLFYTHFDFWGDSFGSLFYANQCFNIILFISGVLLSLRKYFEQFGEKRIQTALFTIAIIIPMAANLLYVFRYFEKIFGFAPPFDITPISASASLIIFTFATFKFQFFDNLKIARRVALSNTPEGILLIKGNRIADFNETFIKMAATGKLVPMGKEGIVRTVGNTPYSLNRKLFVAFNVDKVQDFTYQTSGGDFIRAIYRPVEDKLVKGAFLRFIDITAKQRIISKLQMKIDESQAVHQKLTLEAETKKGLVVARTRNFIAGEAHDILGHSIMLTISLLEIARLSKNKSVGAEYIQRAKKILCASFTEISSITLTDNKSPAIRQGIKERLEELANEFRSDFVAVEVNCSHSEQEYSQMIEDVIFKLCREGITNALRHGKSNIVNIILRRRNDVMELFIIDNGIGCEKVKKGMGLTGMEERMSLLKGTFICHSLDGQGFCIKAVAPLF